MSSAGRNAGPADSKAGERVNQDAPPVAGPSDARTQRESAEAIGSPELAMRLRELAYWLDSSPSTLRLHSTAGSRAYADPQQSRTDLARRLAELLDVLQRLEIANPALVAFGASRLDVVRRILSWREASVRLTLKECEALAYLMRRPGEVVTYRDLRRDIWRLRDDVDSNVVHVTLSALRKKLVACRGALRMTTVRGVGVVLRTSSDEASCI